MSASHREGFKPASEGFWSRLVDTPLTELWHGRVTGSANARRIIAHARLPRIVADGIWRCVQSSRLRRANRLSLAAELVSTSARQLAAGRSEADLAAELNERALLVDSIETGKFETPTAPRQIPLELVHAIQQIAIRVRGQVRRREVALGLYERCAVELSAGVTVGQLIERFGDGAVLAPLVSRPRLRPIILEASLPVELLRIVQQVSAGTKLWRTEQDEVARELCDHFADGLTAGHTAQELAAAFGTPAVAARLIRRAKIRNRSLAWHVGRRSLQSTLAAGVLIILSWSWLIYRFNTVHPGTIPDHIEEWDKQTALIPLSDRAWPLFREGLEKFDRTPITNWNELYPSDAISAEVALYAAPGQKHWPAALELLHHNQASLALFLKATERREFGYVYRDPANDSWLRAQRGQTAEETYPRDEYDMGILLPHIQDLGLAARLIGTAAHEALAEGDGSRAQSLLRSRLRMVDQLWHASEFAVVDVIALSNLRAVAVVATRMLSEQPQLLSDRELKDLAHELGAVCDGRPRVRFDGDRDMLADWIARSYSDDGAGQGRFTAAGFKSVCKELDLVGRSRSGTISGWEWLGPQLADPTTGPLMFELIGSGLAAVVADRQEMQARCDELMTLRAGDIERPYWERPATSAYAAELARLNASASLRRRFSPLLALLNTTLSAPDWNEAINESGMQAVTGRDTVLVAVALELFHRREGKWPVDLPEMVPGLLPRVPIDQFDGKPLRYRLVDGRPVVYSVGPDRRDDGGTFPPDGTSGRKAATGDWRLFPPIEDPEE